MPAKEKKTVPETDSPTQSSSGSQSGSEVIPKEKLKAMRKKYSADAKLLNRLFFSRVISKDQFEIAEIKVKERLRIIDDLLAKEEDIESLQKIKNELEMSLDSLFKKYKLNENRSCTEEDIADIKKLCSDNILSGVDLVSGKETDVGDEKIRLLTRKIDEIFENYIVDLTDSAIDQMDRLPTKTDDTIPPKKTEDKSEPVPDDSEASKKGAFSKLKSAFSFSKRPSE